MAIRDAFLQQFDFETSKTRITLERVPIDKFGWKPHPKSGTMGWLAGHLVEIPQWVKPTLELTEMDIAPGGVHMTPPPPAASTKELLERFDKGAAEARAAMAGAADEVWGKPWSLLSNGAVLFTMPRVVVVQSFVISHSIHHRAQLGVYLRLNDIAVPAVYGPSADEAGM